MRLSRAPIVGRAAAAAPRPVLPAEARRRAEQQDPSDHRIAQGAPEQQQETAQEGEGPDHQEE
eukprot:9383282-Pyramimonas_sp.AAC.1